MGNIIDDILLAHGLSGSKKLSTPDTSINIDFTVNTGQSLKVGDLVDIINGKATKFKCVETPVVWKTSITSKPFALALDSNRILVAYSQGGYVCFVILQVNNDGSIVVGTTSTVNCSYAPSSISLSKSDDNNAVICTLKGQYYMYAVAMTTSGLNIYPGTLTQIGSSQIGGGGPYKTTYLGSSGPYYYFGTVALVGSSSPYTPYVHCFQVNGTNISGATSQSLGINNSAYGIVSKGNGKGLVVLQGSVGIAVRGFTYYGSTITMDGTGISDIPGFNTSIANADVVNLDYDYAVVVTTFNGVGQIGLITTGGSLMGSVQNIPFTGSYEIDIERISSNQVIVSTREYKNSSYGSVEIVIATIQKTPSVSVTITEPLFPKQGGYYIGKLAKIGEKVAHVFYDSSNGSYGTIQLIGVSPKGVALNDAVENQNVTVCVEGIASGLLGLIPGSFYGYFANTKNGLAPRENGTRFAFALTTSDLLILNGYWR